MDHLAEMYVDDSPMYNVYSIFSPHWYKAKLTL